MLYECTTPRTLRSILEFYCTPSDECIADFERVAVLNRIKRYNTVFRQGDLCNCLYLNRVGLMRVVFREEAHEDTLLFGSSGDVFTSMQSYYFNAPSLFSLESVVNSEYWSVNFTDFRNLCERHPELNIWLCNILAEQCAVLEKRYVFLNMRSAKEKFTNFLENNSLSLRPSTMKFIIDTVPLKYIAQYLKVTPQTLSKLRKEFYKGTTD